MKFNEIKEKIVGAIAEEHAAPKPKLTRADIGRARRAYITETHGHVIICGHKFHPANPPGGNCKDCWNAFFNVHPQMTKSCADVCANPKMGEAMLERAQGSKFVKHFRRFITENVKAATEADKA